MAPTKKSYRPKQVYKTFANCQSVFRASVASNCHFASVPSPLVEHVSALSNSLSLRSSFSSLLTAKTKSKSPPTLASDWSNDIHAARPLKGERAGPPGCKIAPTAVEREMLFGSTRKLLDPGIIRRPYRSPKLDELEC